MIRQETDYGIFGQAHSFQRIEYRAHGIVDHRNLAIRLGQHVARLPFAGDEGIRPAGRFGTALVLVPEPCKRWRCVARGRVERRWKFNLVGIVHGVVTPRRRERMMRVRERTLQEERPALTTLGVALEPRDGLLLDESGRIEIFRNGRLVDLGRPHLADGPRTCEPRLIVQVGRLLSEPRGVVSGDQVSVPKTKRHVLETVERRADVFRVTGAGPLLAHLPRVVLAHIWRTPCLGQCVRRRPEPFRIHLARAPWPTPMSCPAGGSCRTSAVR